MKRPWKADTGAGSSPEPAGTLLRSRAGGSDSIRGRISGPIPIPSPLDDEFPMRLPGTGIARPLDASDDKETRVESPAPDREKQSPVPLSTSASPAPAVAQSVTPDPEPVRTPEPRPNTVLRNSPGRRTNVSSTLRYSVASQDTTAQTSSSRDQPQRKKSVLRGALGRLFGRKKKGRKSGSQTSIISEEKPAQGVSTLHHSDPTALTHSISKIETNRSVSLPVTEFDRALRSHSIGPQDVMAIESARNSLSADFSLSRKRSGGNGTRLSASRRTDGMLTGLSPRPASTHGRGSALVYGVDDPEQIGRAITSDFSGLKRRSRSLSGLPALDDEQAKLRRRSDEIRYWRESHGPLTSPLSSEPPEGEDRTATAFGIPDSAAGLPPKTPPQPFSFGDLAAMNEMAGMKITQAASMETRIGSLEARSRRLEKVVTQLCNAVPGFRPHVENTPDRAPPAPQTRDSTTPQNAFTFRAGSHDHFGGSTRPSTRHSDISRLSSADAPTFVGSYPRPPLPQAFGSTKRPISTATIRGVASLPTLSKDMTAPFTLDHYLTLLALVETERSARLALEAEVRRLGHQVKLAARSSAYRTTLGEAPLTGYSLGETSAFDDDEEEDDDDYGTALGTKKPRRSSVLPEDSGIGAGLESDDFEESFATPREEPRAFTPSGTTDVDADEEIKRAARTLSLSQLTYNSAPPNSKQEGTSQPI